MKIAENNHDRLFVEGDLSINELPAVGRKRRKRPVGKKRIAILRKRLLSK